MLSSLAQFGIWLLLAISLIIIGWDEPLRYKFMNRSQIAREERAIVAAAPKKRPAPMQRSVTSLDNNPTSQRPRSRTQDRPQFGDR